MKRQHRVRNLASSAALSVMVLSTTSCDATRLGPIRTTTTGADKRLVYMAPIGLDQHNRVVPQQILCAEPSPDIAKVVSQAFSGSTAINLKGTSPNTPVEVDLQQVLAFSKSNTEAIAQMTERLATIQLLRDAQYRACEAYSNGAISDVMYGILISRFGDTMVTMLTAELAAGNFGRSLATLSGAANSSASAQKGLQDAVDNLLKAQKELADAQKAQGAVAADASNDAKKAAADKVTEKQKAVSDKEAALKTAQNQATIMMQASANSAANTSASGVGAARTVAQDGVALAQELEKIQTNYLYKINSDPQIVSCILAVGSDRLSDDLKMRCVKDLEDLSKESMDILKTKLEQRSNEPPAKSSAKATTPQAPPASK